MIYLRYRFLLQAGLVQRRVEVTLSSKPLTFAVRDQTHVLLALWAAVDLYMLYMRMYV